MEDSVVTENSPQGNLFQNQSTKSMDEQTLQQTLDCMPVGVMLVSHDGKIGYINHAITSILQYTAQELIHQSLEMLLPLEFRAGHAQLMDGYLKDPHQRQMGVGRNLYAVRKDEVKIPIEIGLNPVEMAGRSWILTTLIDISQRVKAEQMFQQSVSVAPHGVLVIGGDGTIQMANQFLCLSFGYEEDELIGQPVEMLLPVRYRTHHQSLRKGYSAAPSVRVMGPGRDLTALHKNGREFPVEIGLSPFDIALGTDQILVSIMDITERKRAELELKETNTNLEEFTYVASHDLRSPLRGIADLLQWIRDDLEGEKNPDVDKNLDRIQIRIQRMEQLIDNLLAYARAGRKETEYQEINISTLVDDIADFIQLPSEFSLIKNLQMDYILASRTPLEIVLRNLLSNAVKHHDKREGTIVVSSRADNDMCCITICDDGPGIPESSIERVFRLFQTLSAAERNSTGIGLSVSRRLIETHGGTISVENNTHQRGLTFYIRWPRFVRTDTHD